MHNSSPSPGNRQQSSRSHHKISFANVISSLSRKFRGSRIHYGVTEQELLAIVESSRHCRGVLPAHPVTIVTDHRLLLGFMISLQTNPKLIRWQVSLSQLDSTIECLKGKMNTIAHDLTRIYNPIKIPLIRDYFSPTENRLSFTAQLPVITNHLTLPTPYLHIPLPTITSYTTMPSQTNNRITSGNSTRRYDYDGSEYCEFLDINHREDDRTRTLTSQLQQAASANR